MRSSTPRTAPISPKCSLPEQLLAANGLEGALRPSLGQGLGPALGGIIVGAFFPAIGAVIVTASYTVAFVIVLFLSRRHETADPATPAEKTNAWDDLRAGVRYVSRTRWLRWTLFFGSSLALIIQGPIEVLLPFLTRDRFDDAGATFGMLLAAFGIGGAVGSLVVSSLRLLRRYLTFMILCWGGGTLPLVLLGLTDNLALMLAALFVVGGATGSGVVIWGILLQRLVPRNMVGRVASVSIAFVPVSIAIAGPLSLIVPAETIFVVAGVVPPALALVAPTAGRMRSTERQLPLDA